MSGSRIPLRAVELWDSFATRWTPPAVLIAAWALLALPLVFFRGFNGDEGLAVTIARSALENGDWLTPHVFNERFVERPTLLSWIVAAVSWPFGEVSQFSARLTVAAFLLAGCALIYALLRREGASIPARILAVAVFLGCPLTQRGYVALTADMPLAVLLFAAFFVWWSGHAAARLTVLRWVLIGGILALAALMKGPQPVAYFGLGIGVYVLVRREWRQVPGLVLAGVLCALPTLAWYWHVYASGDEAQWAAFMRFKGSAPLPGPLHELPQLIGETLPAVLLAAALLLFGPAKTGGRRRNLVLALSCYAFVTSVVVLFWPGGSTARYFFPALPALSAMAGLAYDRFRGTRPALLLPGCAVMVAVLLYALAYSWASPFLPQQFRAAQRDAARIESAMRGAPAPLYRTGAVGLNVMPYIPGTILQTPPAALLKVSGPAWFAVTPPEAAELLRREPQKVHAVLTFGTDGEWRLLRHDP